MAAKPTFDDVFKKPREGGRELAQRAKCGGKTFERKRMRIGCDVVIIYCAGCKTALGVVPAMAFEEMIESLRREIKKT